MDMRFGMHGHPENNMNKQHEPAIIHRQGTFTRIHYFCSCAISPLEYCGKEFGFYQYWNDFFSKVSLYFRIIILAVSSIFYQIRYGFFNVGKTYGIMHDVRCFLSQRYCKNT